MPAKKEAAFIFVRHSRISSTWYSIHVIVKLACSVKVIRNYSREETNLLSLGFDQITERNNHEESRTTAARCCPVLGQRPSWIISKLNLSKFGLPYVPIFFFLFETRSYFTIEWLTFLCDSQISAWYNSKWNIFERGVIE